MSKHSKTKLKYLLTLFSIVILLSGCSRDKMEIDRITFPVALGIDYDEKSNMIKIYAQVTTLSTPSVGMTHTEKSYKVIEGKGETLLMAMTDAINHAQQSISWDHLLIIVFTSKMAEHGINDELEYLCRLDQVRFNSYLLLTDENLNDLLESTPKMESGLATPLAGMSLIADQSTDSKLVTLRDFTMSYLCKDASPVIPLVSIFKKEEKQQKEIELDYKGLGVFRNDRLIGRLDESGTLGMLIVGGLKDQGSMVIPDYEDSRNNEITISGIITKTKIIPGMEQNKPSIKVEIEAEYDISEVPFPRKSDIDSIDKVNLQVAAFMKKEAEATIKKAQTDLKADVFGFGGKIYRKYPAYWLKSKDNWQEIFPTVPVNVEVTAQLDNTGFTLGSLKYWFGKD